MYYFRPNFDSGVRRRDALAGITARVSDGSHRSQHKLSGPVEDNTHTQRSFPLEFLHQKIGWLAVCLSGDPYGANNKPLRGGTNEVERVARDQGQDFVRAGVQY